MGIILGFLFFNPIGYVDTQLACHKDGGLRGHIAVKKAGFFLDRSPGASECKLCPEFVLAHQVSYVEYSVYGTPPDFFRVFLGDAGEPACSPTPNISGAKVPQGKCLIISKLDQKPREGYSLSVLTRSGSIEHVQGKLGSTLNRATLEVRDLSNDKVVLAFTTYGYATPLEKMLGPSPGLYQCPDKKMTLRDFMALAFAPGRPTDKE